MIDSYLPFIPIILLYLFTYHYNKKNHRKIILKGKLSSYLLFFITSTIGFWGGMAYILDPNEMGRSITTTSYSYLYTTGRVLGFWIIACSYTLFYSCFLKPDGLFIHTQNTTSKNHKVKKRSDLLWVGYKVIFLLMSITASFSGGYGFLTRTCWGLEKTIYISDTFQWWIELGWCIAGFLGIWVYFRFIKNN